MSFLLLSLALGMISHEDTIPTRLVERHDVDALIIVPLDGGGCVTVADWRSSWGFLLDPIASLRDSASILNDTPPLSCRSSRFTLSRNSNANLRTERAADEDQTAWSLALE